LKIHRLYTITLFYTRTTERVLLVGASKWQSSTFCTQISPILPPSRHCKFPHSIHANQRTVRFSGRNARDRTSFGRRPVVVSWWPEYNTYQFFTVENKDIQNIVTQNMRKYKRSIYIRQRFSLFHSIRNLKLNTFVCTNNLSIVLKH